MTAARMLPAMDVHHHNEEHETQYRIAKTRYPTDESSDQFELFICPYDDNHKVASKQWRIHLSKCKKNYGGNYRSCPFNAAHHIPEPEFEWHQMTCSDQNVIRQDIQGSNSGWQMATQVDHNPVWKEPDTGDDWETECDDDENIQEFELDTNKGMPFAIIPQTPQVYEQEELYGNEEQNVEEDEYMEGEIEEESAAVLNEELLPEKPANWNDMNKTQRKNYRRRYDRQRQRMREEGVTDTDFALVTDSCQWTEQEQEAKLNAIKAAFPLALEKQHATRVDFTSLLNIVCQKIRLNLPEYHECPPSQGGFAYKCRVFQTWYQGKSYCSTKKDAKHDCAKWALLKMDIPGLDGSLPGSSHPRPVKPKNGSTQMREGDEIGRLMAAGAYPYSNKQTVPLRQPRLQQPNSPSKDGQQQSQNPQSEQQQSSTGWDNASAVCKERQQQPHNEQRLPSQQQWQQQQQHQLHQQQSPSKQTWTGWGAPNPQMQQTQQQQQQPQSVRPRQPKSNGIPSFTNAMQNMSISSNEDFPSLGGNNEWKTVNKKGGAGVAAGRVYGKRGRGRGTAMKL